MGRSGTQWGERDGVGSGLNTSVGDPDRGPVVPDDNAFKHRWGSIGTPPWITGHQGPHVKGYDADGKLLYDSDRDELYDHSLS